MFQPNSSVLDSLALTLPKTTFEELQTKCKMYYNFEAEKKVQTPATNCTQTSFKKNQGNAIEIMRRKQKNQKQGNQTDKIHEDQHLGQNRDFSISKQLNEKAKQEEMKILIKSKAVFFGKDCELPYLQSTDIASSLYATKSINSQTTQEEVPLLNPPQTIEVNRLISLKSLHVYYSQMESLRQLGTGWRNLKQLSVVYCGLVDLSGLSSFTSLEYLFVPFNKIKSVSDLMFHPTICCLDFQCNQIESQEEMEYLFTIDRLEYLNINGNPIMSQKPIKRKIQDKFPKILEQEQYKRDEVYESGQQRNDWQLFSHQKIESTNHLINLCNQITREDEINLSNYSTFTNSQIEKSEQSIEKIPFISYDREDIDSESTEDEKIKMTPLIHFILPFKEHTQTLTKYLQSKLYIHMKKKEKKQSKLKFQQASSSSRIAKFNFSTKLMRQDLAFSQQKDTMQNKQPLSMEKTRKGRLSMSRGKRIRQHLEKSPVHSNLSNDMFSSIASKTFTLKRNLLKKGQDLIENPNKMGSTLNFKS